MLSVGVVCSLAIVTRLRSDASDHRSATRSPCGSDAILDVLPGATTIDSVSTGSDPRVSFNRHPPTPKARTSSSPDSIDTANSSAWRSRLRGMGYQDFIRLLYGYSPDDQAIIGIRVLESRETPGLGDRIETDADFLSNFQRLDVALELRWDAARPPDRVCQIRKEDGRLADRRDHGSNDLVASDRGDAARQHGLLDSSRLSAQD